MKRPIPLLFTLLCAAIASFLIGLALLTPANAASTPAALTWSVAEYDFGFVPVGQTASQTFTLSSTGGRSSGTITVSLSGSAAFTITSDGCTGRALGPSKSCRVTVQYAPVNTNGDTGTLAATGEHASASMALTGTGGVARHIYWTNDNVNNGTVGRASVNGTGVNLSFITGASFPVGVAVDSGHIYWTNFNFVNPGKIGRANLDGTGVNQSFITGLGPTPLQGLAVDSGHIYWNNDMSIGRANLDGTGVNQNFIMGVLGQGLAVDSGHIYWSNFNPGTIGRANLDGTGVNQSFITGASFPVGVAVDSGHLYWGNTGVAVNSIGRANLDGTGVNQNFITGASNPTGVAVDSGHIYWANRTPVTIGRANLDGTGVNQSFITLPITTSVFMVAVDPQP